MTKNDADRIRATMKGQGWKFINLYPFGVEPYWSVHDTLEIAKNQAMPGALHIGLPIHGDWFDIGDKT